jgi:hypothetical protein
MIKYAVVRETSNGIVSQGGYLDFTYNADHPTNNKWEKNHRYDGDASITFSITDTGQVQFSTDALIGSNHTGEIMFSATTLLNG